MAKKSNVLEKLELEVKDLERLLKDKRVGIEKEKTSRAPSQALKTVNAISDWLKSLSPSGVSGKLYGIAQKELQTLTEYDPKYAENLTSYDRYDGIPKTAEVRFICEVLLSGSLHPKADMFDVLNKIIQTRTMEGNPAKGK